MAYWSGIASLVEDLLPVVIGRPPAVAAVVPAGDPGIGSGSKRDAVGHCALLFSLKRVPSHSCNVRTLAYLNRRHRTDWVQKKTHVRGIRATASALGVSWVDPDFGSAPRACLRSRPFELAGEPSRLRVEAGLRSLEVLCRHLLSYPVSPQQQKCLRTSRRGWSVPKHKVAALQPAARGKRREAGSQLRGQA